MSKARFLSSALDGSAVTMSVTNNGVTKGPLSVSAFGELPISEGLTITVQELEPTGATFAPHPVQWQIRVTGTSYATPDYLDVIPEPFNDITQGDENTMRLAWEAYDPSFQRCQFVVHTGDTGNYRNDWVGSAAHRDKSVQYGQNCGHVYDTPGTYTGRSIFVYDDEGNWATHALPDLVVGDPDVVYDDISTIVVSPTSDWTGAPTHDVANRCTTFDQAAARYIEMRGDAAVTSGMRICIQAGSSFNERSRQIGTRDAKGILLIDTYGGTDKFIYSEKNLSITPPSIAVGDDASLFKIDTKAWAIRVCNGDFDMGWDAQGGRPTNDTGWGDTTTLSRSFMRVPEPANIWANSDEDIGKPIYRNTDPAAKIILHNLDVHGCGWFMYASNNNLKLAAKAVATFANDCEFYDNSDYTFFTPQNLYVLGCKHYDKGDTDLGMSGRGRTMGTSRGWRGHPILIREGNVWTFYVRGSFVEARGGWSGQSGKTGHTGGQPMFRLQSSGEDTVQPGGWIYGRGRRYVWVDNALSGYFDNTAGEDRGGHILLECCFLFHDLQSGAQSILTAFSGRNSVRNCVYLVLDTPPFLSSNAYPSRDVSRFEVQGWASRFGFFIKMINAPFNQGGRWENRHNTFVMLRDDDGIHNAPYEFRFNDGFDDADHEIVEGNNVLYTPNLSVPEGPAMDKIDLPAGIRVLPPWMKLCWERKEITFTSSVANGAFSPPFEYPVDWYEQPTTGSDYAGTGNNNSLQIEARVMPFDNEVTAFVPGETVTNGSASATIYGVEVIDSGVSGRLFLGPVTGGNFANNDLLTSASGEALANGIKNRNLKYDNLITEFVIGETVTNGTASAEILDITITDAVAGKGTLALGPVSGGNFLDNQDITSASGAAKVQGTLNLDLNEARWYQPDDAYPNASGVQQGGGNGRVDMITVIHDCDASGVVQTGGNIGTGTHFKIENRWGHTMPPADYILILDRGHTSMVADPLLDAGQITAMNADFKLWRPTTPQALEEGIGTTRYDFNRNLRPNAGYVDSPTSGTNATGAILPA